MESLLSSVGASAPFFDPAIAFLLQKHQEV
jgi:hypothetical protein